MSSERVPVLVVDDDVELLRLYVALIDEHPRLQVVGTRERADDLAAAIDKTGARLILLDLSMPGTPPLRAMTELAERAELRFVISSGHDDRQTVDEAVAAGAWGYVSKFAGLDAIVDALVRVADGDFVLP